MIKLLSKEMFRILLNILLYNFSFKLQLMRFIVSKDSTLLKVTRKMTFDALAPTLTFFFNFSWSNSPIQKIRLIFQDFSTGIKQMERVILKHSFSKIFYL